MENSTAQRQGRISQFFGASTCNDAHDIDVSNPNLETLSIILRTWRSPLYSYIKFHYMIMAMPDITCGGIAQLPISSHKEYPSMGLSL